MSLARELEEQRAPSRDYLERFRGYGVVGLPFASGHLLAFRRMTSSSIGPPFTSVWHRDPSGTWSMYVDEDPGLSCPRYFGGAVDRVLTEEIELSWEGPMRLSLRVPRLRFQWGMRMYPGGLTRALSWVGRMLPSRIWDAPLAVSALGQVGGRVLNLGELSLSGRTPNGHRFLAAPRLLLRIDAAAAVVDGQDLGSVGILPERVCLGDFRFPKRGIFAMGRASFEGVNPEPLAEDPCSS